MNLVNRFQGVFLSPQPTFKALSEKTVYLDALVIVLICVAIFSFIISPIVQRETADFWRDNVKMKERLGEEAFNRRLRQIENPSKALTYISAFVISPIVTLIGFLISGLVLLGLGRLTSTQGQFPQVFAAFVHASFIDKILGNALRLILILSRKSFMQVSTSLAAFFPKMEYGSVSYSVLTQIDIFQLWLFGVLSFGLSAIFKIELKKALFISCGFWVLKTLLYVGQVLLFRKFMG
jgi:hypothetical protein